MSDDVSEIIIQLEEAGKLFEVHEVRTFGGYLDETNEEVRISVIDMGDSRHATRYSASAVVVDDPSRHAAGNAEASLDMAIHVVHWNDLKKRS
ncbi:hypothetical protein [Arthrobacter glacialis]|uniref:hypothetical protein n=1 Tax=Arthrobacter glacialis TaxID=1664 RepID=UPI000CD47AFE|nr:hypothetical protein [Arthrobacter glacialis]POH56975.1 hypothetical protein CVS28_18025 [Arthrobacter glacialis]